MELPHPANSPEGPAIAAEPESILSELATYLGAKPDMADRAEYLFFLTASSVFLLGILAFLGYIYLDPVRERLYQVVLNKEE
ncbi:MAG: hypothetical protein WCD80_00925 [Desulfobaccales bacterium]